MAAVEIELDIEEELKVETTRLGGASSRGSISLFDKSIEVDIEAELAVETTRLGGASSSTINSLLNKLMKSEAKVEVTRLAGAFP